MDSLDRHDRIIQILESKLIPELDKINIESDIYKLLKNRPQLNDIPLKVKDYLKIK